MTDRAQAVALSHENAELIERIYGASWVRELNGGFCHCLSAKGFNQLLDAARASAAPQTPAAGEGESVRELLETAYEAIDAGLYFTAKQGIWDAIAALSPSPAAGGRGELGSRAVPCQERTIEQGLADVSDGVPYAVDSAADLAAHAAYAVLRCCNLIRAGDWRVPLSIGRNTQSMIDGRKRRAAKPTEAGGSTGGRLGNQNPNSLPVEGG